MVLERGKGRDPPGNNLQLIKREQCAADALWRRFAVVKWDDGAEGSDTEAGDESANGKLHDASDGGYLDNNSDDKDNCPDEDGSSTAEAVGSECLAEGSNEGTEYQGSIFW